MSSSHMSFENLFAGTKMTTFITRFWKLSVIVESVILQCIWHGELLTTIFTSQSFVMIFLHVGLIHAYGVVSYITSCASHDGSILCGLKFESLVSLIALRGSRFRQQMSLLVSQ